MPLLFNFPAEYDIRKFQVNQDVLKLHGTHLLVVSADVNIMGGSTHSIKKNTDALVVASKKVGLEVNADKTLYMVMYVSRLECRTKSQYHNIKTDHSPFEGF